MQYAIDKVGLGGFADVLSAHAPPSQKARRVPSARGHGEWSRDPPMDEPFSPHSTRSLPDIKIQGRLPACGRDAVQPCCSLHSASAIENATYRNRNRILLAVSASRAGVQDVRRGGGHERRASKPDPATCERCRRITGDRLCPIRSRVFVRVGDQWVGGLANALAFSALLTSHSIRRNVMPRESGASSTTPEVMDV